MRGFMSADGTAEISAISTTGDPECTVGQREASTEYSYAFQGSFTRNQGRATCIGVRPCFASFIKQQ